jgi:hypothetical protein
MALRNTSSRFRTASVLSRGSRVRFSWEEFCVQYRVPFVTSGPNTARDHISIRCPFCGMADPSHHMGLSLDVNEPAWGCWRNADHRGRHPLRLVQELLGCSTPAAKQVVEALKRPILATTRRVEQVPRPVGPLVMPAVFLPLIGEGYGGRFAQYLAERGFGDWQAVATDYDLRYCLVGDYKWRLIIPIYLGGQLVTWTGRGIQPGMEPRYKTLPDKPAKEPGKPVALANIKELIYNSDSLNDGGRVLVVTEGPLDAIKIDAYAKHRGVRATCLFGTAITSKQIKLLALAATKFQRVDILLDVDARSVAWQLATALRGMYEAVSVRELPPGIKDPGELSKDMVQQLYD